MRVRALQPTFSFSCPASSRQLARNHNQALCGRRLVSASLWDACYGCAFMVSDGVGSVHLPFFFCFSFSGRHVSGSPRLCWSLPLFASGFAPASDTALDLASVCRRPLSTHGASSPINVYSCWILVHNFCRFSFFLPDFFDFFFFFCHYLLLGGPAKRGANANSVFLVLSAAPANPPRIGPLRRACVSRPF